MQGSGIVVCNHDGTWPEELPRCLRACVNPFQTTEHSLKPPKDVYQEGDELELQCELGFLSSSVEPLLCLRNGSWKSENLPVCLPATCQPPVENHLIVSGPNLYNSTIYFSCDLGFHLDGESSARCLIDGSWSAETPTCQPVDCGGPPTIDHGRVYVNSTSYLSHAVYHCTDGYHLHGGDTTSCTDNSTWMPEPPYCEAVQCRDVITVENGTVQMTGNLYLDELTLFCHQGYQVQGHSASSCSENGSWMPDVSDDVCFGNTELIINWYFP